MVFKVEFCKPKAGRGDVYYKLRLNIMQSLSEFLLNKKKMGALGKYSKRRKSHT